MYDDVYIKTESDTLFSNIGLSSYNAKNEVGDKDNESSTLVLNTYSKRETYTFVSHITISLDILIFNFI